MKHCLLFLGLFFSVFSAQAQDTYAQKPTPPWLIPDSSRAASWAVLFTPTELVSSGTHFEFEAPLFKKKPHTRWFAAPTFYRAEVDSWVFNDDQLPGGVGVQPPSRLEGLRLSGGLRQTVRGVPFHARRFRVQTYLQAGGGIGWLNRHFEGIGWRTAQQEDGTSVFLPATMQRKERLYRSELLVGLGMRAHTKIGLLFNGFLGVGYQQVWQGKSLNFGWPEITVIGDGNRNFDFEGAMVRASLSVGWAKASNRKYPIPLSKGKIRRMKAIHEAKEQAQKARMRDSSHYQTMQFQIAPTDLLLGSLPLGLEFTGYDSTRNKAIHLHMAVFAHLSWFRRGAGFMLGMRRTFDGRPFYTEVGRMQSYYGFSGAVHSGSREELDFNSQSFNLVTQRALCFDLGFEVGTRKYTSSGLVLDLFVGTAFRYGDIVEGPENAWRPSITDFDYRGFIPRLGARLGLYKQGGVKLWAKK